MVDLQQVGVPLVALLLNRDRFDPAPLHSYYSTLMHGLMSDVSDHQR